MNNKQTVILGLGIIALILIYLYTPRYKITWMGPDNFIKTEQTSSLYKRSNGTVKLHWDKIGPYSAAVFALGGILFFALKNRQ